LPKYYIGLRSETHLNETLEVERDDITALRLELARFVGDLLKEHAALIWEDQDWRVDVTNDTGLILFTMEICATDAPATAALRR
jgi:hypothetical protein